MTITVFGAFRANTTLTDAAAGFGTLGATFEISAYSQITISDGVDGTVVDGDDLINEVPNDPTQTFLGNAIFWDYSIQVNDGVNTYQVGVFDYDINGNGASAGVDAEDGFFIAFIGGSIPPLNTTLTLGPVLDNGAAVDVDTLVPCFTEGTLIETVAGPRPIESICVNDDVVTLDNGLQPVRWIGFRTLKAKELSAKPKLCPIKIVSGALGDGLPKRDLCVSPQHRMLCKSPIATRIFGEEEVLITAKKLTDLPGIFVDEEVESVCYFHLLFDRHEIIFAEGAPAESLFTGPIALESVGDKAYKEILCLFPEVSSADYLPKPARQIPQKGKQISNFIRRHVHNKKPLISVFKTE